VIADILTIAISVLLLIYWFAYSCRLILESDASREYAGALASTMRLSFVHVEDHLKAGSQPESLDKLHVSLQRDYCILTSLLHDNKGSDFDSIQKWTLMVYYRAMQVWFILTRRPAVPQARLALAEMSKVLSFFANSLGQHAAY
jgi:hypothetical protein